jgi:hypothetical protein
MPGLRVLLLLLAVFLFVVAGLGVPAQRFNLVALGLAAFAGASLVP